MKKVGFYKARKRTPCFLSILTMYTNSEEGQKSMSSRNMKIKFRNFCEVSPFAYCNQSIRSYTSFFQSTSLHGYNYLQMEHNKFYTILWIIAILSMSGVGIGFLVANTREFMKAGLVTTLETSSAPLKVI